MNNFISKYSTNSILISLFLIIVSLFLIFIPTVSLNVIVITIGIILTANGIFHTISYFSSPKELKMFSFELAMGVISLLVGLVFIFNPGVVNGFLSFIIGVWIILKSITSLQLALNMKTYTDKWVLSFLLALLTFVLGTVLLFNPFTASILVMACGIMLLITEVANIIEISTMKKYIKG